MVQSLDETHVGGIGARVAAYTTWYAGASWPACGSPDDLLAAQGNRCAVCAVDFNEPNIRMMLDHCHFCGLVRGWLCNGCNVRESSSTDADIVAYRSMPPASLAGLSVLYRKRRSGEALDRYVNNLRSAYKVGVLPGDCAPDLSQLIVQALARMRKGSRQNRENWAEIFRLQEVAKKADARALAAEEEAAARVLAAESAASSAALQRERERLTVRVIGVLAAMVWAAGFVHTLAGPAVPESTTLQPPALLFGAFFVYLAGVAAVAPWMLWRPLGELFAWPRRYPYNHFPIVAAVVILALFDVIAMLGGMDVLDFKGFQHAVMALLIVLMPFQIGGIVLTMICIRRADHANQRRDGNSITPGRAPGI